jgi:hypothetical protein
METLEALGNMEKDDPFEVIYLHQTKAIKCYGCGNKFIREKELEFAPVNLHLQRMTVINELKDTSNYFTLIYCY